MSDTPTNASSVRDAARLIFAAEELLAVGGPDNLQRVAAAIEQVARAGKALRANHLDDALDHVVVRCAWMAGQPSDPADVPDEAPDVGAASTALPSDVEALRDRIRGGDPT